MSSKSNVTEIDIAINQKWKMMTQNKKNKISHIIQLEN
jgi:hypothetical protein